MNQPGPEARITNLEKEAMSLGARIEEASADTAECFRDLKQDIKKLDDSVTASYKQIGDTFVALGEDLDTVIATMATKDDMAAMESRINGTIDELKSLVMQLLQQKGE